MLLRKGDQSSCVHPVPVEEATPSEKKQAGKKLESGIGQHYIWERD